MEQRKIMELLQEAASPSCTWERQNEIHCLLGAATAALDEDGIYEVDTEAAGMSNALDCLFTDTCKNRRDQLPALFPFFATICGNREEGMLVADVDWSLVR